jgi:hypothetical protein
MYISYIYIQTCADHLTTLLDSFRSTTGSAAVLICLGNPCHKHHPEEHLFQTSSKLSPLMILNRVRVAHAILV